MWDFSSLTDQGSNPRPRHWKCRVLTTGLPGKSQNVDILGSYFPFQLRTQYPLSVVTLCLSSCISQVPLLCDPMHCSPPGSSVHEILQARIVSGLPCPPPEILPNKGSNSYLLHLLLQADFFPAEPLWKSLDVVTSRHYYLLFTSSLTM